MVSQCESGLIGLKPKKLHRHTHIPHPTPTPPTQPPTQMASVDFQLEKSVENEKKTKPDRLYRAGQISLTNPVIIPKTRVPSTIKPCGLQCFCHDFTFVIWIALLRRVRTLIQVWAGGEAQETRNITNDHPTHTHTIGWLGRLSRAKNRSLSKKLVFW